MVVEEHPADSGPSAAPASGESVPPGRADSGGVSADQVEAIVKREVAPIKLMLAEMHDAGPSVAEILGGIGWIFGLFGVAAYMKSRNRS